MRFTHRGLTGFASIFSWGPSLRCLAPLLVAGCVVPASAQLQVSDLILEDGPFAYWRLDETDATNAALKNSGLQNVAANFVGDMDGGDGLL